MEQIEAPKVQSLTDIMAELAPANQQQMDVISKKQAAVAPKYALQKQALGAEKTKSFNEINTQATGKGMAFSGIPVHEQAEYLSTKYLPTLGQYDLAQNQEELEFESQLANLYHNTFNKAFDARERQTGYLHDWNKQLQGQGFSKSEREASQLWQSGESQKDRDFKSSESQKDRDFQAKQNAASRAAASARASTGGRVSGADLEAWAKDYVNGKQGIDKKISPADYYAGLSSFTIKTGLGADTYAALMNEYVNTDHKEDYVVH